MIKRILLAFAILALLGISVLVWRKYDTKRTNELRVFGNIEVTEVNLSFKIPGKVIKRYVSEGDIIQIGDLVAYLDKTELKQQRGVQLAKVQQAQAFLNEVQAGNVPREIVQAQATYDSALAEFRRIEDEFRRQQSLLNEQVISQREFDVSSTTLRTAQANLSQAEESLRLLKKDISEERIAQAQAQLQAAIKELAVTDTRLNDSNLYSPLSGWVLTDNIESGEVVVAGTPIVTVADLRDIWFRAYIDESDLGRIKLGQKVNVTTDAYPDKVYQGRISFISQEAEFTPKTVETRKERVKLVYRIKITLDNELQELKPGMPAEGVIVLD